jgi:leucyl aminopeptidase
MNIKLSFPPVSQNPLDLLVVVLDPEKALHVSDDAAVTGQIERATAAFRDKALRREYLVNLGEGGGARAVLLFWSPLLKGFNLWENVKTCTARALRLARDYRMPRVGVLVNAIDAAPLIGKVVEGALLGAYTFDRYKQEKDEFLQKDLQLTVIAHPEHRVDAEARKARYAWVSENVNRCRDLINEPGCVVTPEHIAERAQEIAKEVELEIEVMDPAGLKARGFNGLLRVGQGSAHPPRLVVLRHVPRKASA